jgi:hypothetical protein
MIALDATRAIRQFDTGAISFDELKTQFVHADFQMRQSTEGDSGTVCARAEEGPVSTDVPEALASAAKAGAITAAQKQELMDVYVVKVRVRTDDSTAR